MTEAMTRALPLDKFNRRLLANVHPDDWENPRARSRYHLVVVGGGTGGLVTAAIAASLGAKVALVERRLLGGDCLNFGCVPSKALLRAARAWHAAGRAARTFGGPTVAGPGDFGAVMKRLRYVRAGLSSIDGAPRFTAMGVDVFLGAARFVSPDALEVDGQRLRFQRAVIATGARAATPTIAGLDAGEYFTNETIFNLTSLPHRLVIVGAGPTGCELAQAFARFGSHVTLLQRGPRILPRDEPNAAGIVHRALERDGVMIVPRADGLHAQRVGAQSVLRYAAAGDARWAIGDAVLVATGRVPNVEDLGLDAAQVHWTTRGVSVDSRLRTSNRRIYAVGDIATSTPFTHAADAQARLVVQNALFFGRKSAARLVVPWCTYTSPELAHVGHTEASAREAGIAVDTVRVPLSSVDRAVLDGEDDGFLAVHLVRGTDRIVGGTLVADHAGDMISELTVAMTNRLGLARVGAAIHPYPTQSEVFRKAADIWRRGKLTPRTKRVFNLFFRLFR